MSGFVLSNVHTLYDGTAGSSSALRQKVDLLISNGKVEALQPHVPDRKIGPDYLKIDCSRYTVTPGLIDCHGHITARGTGHADIELMNSQAGLLYVEKILHATLVDGGVTTMRDIAGATELHKRLIEDGILIGPRLKIAICMLSTTGGHADFRKSERYWSDPPMLWPPAPGRPSNLVDGPWECRKRVREVAACGADLIKLCTSPGVVSPSDKLEHRDFTGEEVAAICEEAAARGLPVAAHAHSKSGIALAIEHGVHDIQHISFMDEALAERAAAKKLTVTPTSWVVEELLKAEGLSLFVREKVRQVAEVHARAVALASRAGLKILVGTDPVLPGMHGRNYLELTHLIKDGVDPLTAWFGATGLAAEEIGQDDTGRLIPGKRADFLICDGDVLQAPERLGSGCLIEVVKDGIAYRGGIPALPQRSYVSAARETLGLAEASLPSRPGTSAKS
jgi:imidazolonepropionase-like amidohydrolase